MTDLSRRLDAEQWTPAETAIDAAVQAIELLGADPRLSDAVRLLGDAQRTVADFVDGVARRVDDSQEGDGARYGVPKANGQDRVTPCRAWFADAEAAAAYAATVGGEVWDLVTGQRAQ